MRSMVKAVLVLGVLAQLAAVSACAHKHHHKAPCAAEAQMKHQGGK